MMTQSVMTQVAGLTSGTTTGTAAKGKQSASGFEQLISNSLQSVQKTTSSLETPAAKSTTASKGEKKVSGNTDNTEPADQTNAAQSTTASETGKPAEKVQATKSDMTSSANKADATEDVTEVDEELVAEITAMLQNMKQVVMEALNLTTEEFDQLLIDQGLSLTDLLQPGNLQQFILASCGQTDITAVLTDENLAATMNDLMQAVDNLKTDSDLNLTVEEMKAILDQADAVNNQNVEKFDLTGNGMEEKLTDGKQQMQQASAANVTKGKDEQNTTTVENATATESSTLTAGAVGKAEENASESKQNDKGEQTDTTASDAFQTFIDNLVKTSQETKVDFAGNMTQVTELRNIANQILDRIKISVTTDHSSMELQLNPEHLGKVNLTVQSKNGIMTAQFVVQNEISKEAIESQLHTLRETLNSQGIKVEAIEVTVETYTSEQNTGSNAQNEAESKNEKSGNQISMEEALTMVDGQPEDGTAQDNAGVLGTQIDYTA